jgi:hypothetical protein
MAPTSSFKALVRELIARLPSAVVDDELTARPLS